MIAFASSISSSPTLHSSPTTPTTTAICSNPFLRITNNTITVKLPYSLSLSPPHPRILRTIAASTSRSAPTKTDMASETVPTPSMKLLFVEMGVGYDQHGQDITQAAMRACRDAISSNSIPAFRRGSIPGVTFNEMKLQIKLGVPRPLQNSLDIEKVKSVFPYGRILNIEVVDGGLICSSGVLVEDMGDKNEDCYIVNAAVYVGY
ncbi:hypothetical protein ACH5RR_015282 [Cinchona calisaya]|uniref:50S ribosomal protein L34 n=1 Tax=Cinchona calisaya TaxID=153742 RepID=A0ABD2ZT37_9GENT